MLPRGGRARVILPIALVVAATAAPYLGAWLLSRADPVFAGFLLNPIDGFSYLAKMRQGMDGAVLFRLPYASEPGEGVFLFAFYLLLGHIARLLHAAPLAIFHGARVVGTVLMYLAAWRFLEHFVPEGRGRTWAWWMILIGSGLGWVGIPFGLLALDLWVPEAVPMLTAYASAHFPFAVACLIFGGLALSPGFHGRRGLLGAASGLLLSLLQPFAVGVLAAVGVAWVALETITGAKATDRRSSLVGLAAILAGAAPILIYDAWAVLTHPALAAWNRQNLTPSPALPETLLAYLPLLVFAAFALASRERRGLPSIRFLAMWAVVGLVLLYAPYGLQRRLSLGLYVPLAALAAHALPIEARRLRWAPVALLLLTFPSHLVVIAAGVSGVARGDPSLVLSRAELAAYAWTDENTPAGSLVLAGPRSGNRLPAYADVSVVYGHPFETPNADGERAWVEAVYGWTGAAEGVVAALRERGVDYVYVGPEERALGGLEWIEALEPGFAAGDVTVYQVSSP